MDAGRELDALVAGKVMGWTCVRTESGWDNGPDPVTGGPQIGWYGQPPGEEWEGNSGQIIEEYSTDIATAWKVVEVLAKKGYALALQAPDSVDMNECYRRFKRWTADFSQMEYPSTEAEADTAPLAICLAALNAVGFQFNRREPNP